MTHLCACGCGDLAPRFIPGHQDGPPVSKSPTYRSWCSMKQRCLNPKSPGFENWGGRGIGICEPWIEGFANFLADMGERPEGTSLDRIDVEGDYEPENCRWATAAQQGANKRRNPKTHCKHGHPFDELNTYVDRHGHRACRACCRDREQGKREEAPGYRSLADRERQCGAGHALNEENAYTSPTGRKSCRICKRARERQREREQREASKPQLDRVEDPVGADTDAGSPDSLIQLDGARRASSMYDPMEGEAA